MIRKEPRILLRFMCFTEKISVLSIDNHISSKKYAKMYIFDENHMA